MDKYRYCDICEQLVIEDHLTDIEVGRDNEYDIAKICRVCKKNAEAR